MSARSDATDVLIVGGGVIGCATAYYLASHGVEVLVVDRGALNREASGANAGTLHIQIPAFHFDVQYAQPAPTAERDAYFAATNRLYMEAACMWTGLEAELQADLGVRIVGGLMVAETEHELRVLQQKTAYERSIGMDTRMVSKAELVSMAPNLSPHLIGASYCAAEGFANPLLAGPTFMRRAQAHGARLRQHTRVVDIEAAAARRRFVVETNAGAIEARRIVIAAGAHTRHVTHMVGLDLPILQHPLQVLVSQPSRPLLDHLIQHAGNRHLSMRQTQYGTFVIGGGWPATEPPPLGERVAVRARSVAGNAAVACDVLPALRGVPLARAWAGMTTSTGRKNRIGYIGPYAAAGRGRLFVTVAGGWGFTLSPVLGRLTAELVLSGTSSLATTPFDLEQATRLL